MRSKSHLGSPESPESMKGTLFNLLQDVVLGNEATKRSAVEYVEDPGAARWRLHAFSGSNGHLSCRSSDTPGRPASCSRTGSGGNSREDCAHPEGRAWLSRHARDIPNGQPN